MLKFFTFNNLDGSELRLRGHEGWVHDVKAHENGEWIFSAGEDKTLRMFSALTGQCIKKYEGHQKTVWRVVFLDEDTFLSTSDDHTARLWKISDGSSLMTIHFDENVWVAARLDDSLFTIGTMSGMLQIFEKNSNQLLNSRCSFKAHEHGINDIRVWQNRFATASLDCTAKIWDMDTFECLAVLSDHTKSVRSITMGDSFIVTGSYDGILRVYDAKTYLMIRKISTHGEYIRSVNLVGPEELLLSSSDDKTTRLFDTSTGDLIWTKQFKEVALSTTVLKDGRIATSLRHGEIVVYSPPQHLFPHMKLLKSRRITRSKETQILHDALLSCLSGYSSPSDVCKNMIKYETCSVSFEEWCSAHRILILAVEDGDIPSDTQFNGEQSWWFDELYLAIRNIDLRPNEEYRSAKRCLGEAKQYGVIESIDAVLTALHLTKDLKEAARTVTRAGILIIERILRMEDRLERLKDTYTRYTKYQRKSQLVGIALQVIPIAGGAVAGALSAGSEIVKGLSVKDVTDYALGFGSNIAESHIEALGDRILQKAADSLSPKSIDSMDLSHRERLKEALLYCGLDLNMLKELFLERLDKKHSAILLDSDQTICEGIKGDEEFHAPIVADEDPFREPIGKGQINDLSRLHETAFDISDEYSIEEAKIARKYCASEETVLQVHHQGELEGTENESPEAIANPVVVGNLESLMKHEIIRLKQVEVTASTVESLSQENITKLWAAYACRFDDGEVEKYLRLRESLLETLKANEIYGPELIDRRLISVTNILSVIMEGLQDSGIETNLGLQARLKRFLLDLEL